MNATYEMLDEMSTILKKKNVKKSVFIKIMLLEEEFNKAYKAIKNNPDITEKELTDEIKIAY